MSKHMNIRLLAVFGLLCVATAGGARADIYRCSDPETGKITFSDKACPDRSQGESVDVGGPGADTSTATDAYTKRSASTKSNPRGNLSGPEKYTNQARSYEKGHADAAATGLERKVD